MNILETVLAKMSNINKAQRNFILALLMNLMRLRGKANYRNLSRYSDETRVDQYLSHTRLNVIT